MTEQNTTVAAGGAVLTLDEIAKALNGKVEGASGALQTSGASIDSRTVAPGQLFVAVHGPRHDGHDFLAQVQERGAAAALVHREGGPPGLARVRVPDTTSAFADLARHVRTRARLPVVAITGSAGKTTTKEMTAALLGRLGPVLKTEGNLNNQYGLPLTLMRLGAEHRAAVLELGMSAAGELRHLSGIARPDVAVITLVAPVHLEFFDSVDAIAAAKAEILEGLGPQGVAVLNHDDPRVRRVGEARLAEGRRVLWFGRDRSCQVSAENWRGTLAGMRFDLRLGGQTLDVALPLPGPHFMMNFLAAAAAAHHLGVPAEAIAEAASDLKPASHRGQIYSLAEGVVVIDDCYNSNPVAVDSAVAALELARPRGGGGRRVAFLGDMLELGPRGPELHRECGEKAGPRLDLLVAVGALARHFLEGARAAGAAPEALLAFADAAAAAPEAAQLVRPGDAVLVKGSRGVRMEGIVDALRARFPEGPAR